MNSERQSAGSTTNFHEEVATTSTTGSGAHGQNEPLPRRTFAAALGSLGLAVFTGCTAEAGGASSSPTLARQRQNLTGLAEDVASTIADLRTLTGATAQLVSVLGYWDAGDGGGGMFYWDAASPEDEDDATNPGMIIKPTSNPATGRWKRLTPFTIGLYDTTTNVVMSRISGDEFNVRCFGARGDATTDDAAAFQAAIRACAGVSQSTTVVGPVQYGGVILVPRGTYVLSRTIGVDSSHPYVADGLPPSCILRGEGASGTRNSLSGTVLHFTNTTGDGVAAYYGPTNAAGNVIIENLHIRGPFPAVGASGGGLTITGGSLFTIRNCTFSGFRYGIILDGPDNIVVENCAFIDDTVGSECGDRDTVGIWLCDGNRVISVPQSTNCITIRNCFFSGPWTCIKEDGGIQHLVENCQVNLPACNNTIFADIRSANRTTYRGNTIDAYGTDDAHANVAMFRLTARTQLLTIDGNYAKLNSPFILFEGPDATVVNLILTNNFILGHYPASGAIQGASKIQGMLQSTGNFYYPNNTPPDAPFFDGFVNNENGFTADLRNYGNRGGVNGINTGEPQANLHLTVHHFETAARRTDGGLYVRQDWWLRNNYKQEEHFRDLSYRPPSPSDNSAGGSGHGFVSEYALVEPAAPKTVVEHDWPDDTSGVVIVTAVGRKFGPGNAGILSAHRMSQVWYCDSGTLGAAAAAQADAPTVNGGGASYSAPVIVQTAANKLAVQLAAHATDSVSWEVRLEYVRSQS